MVDGQQPLLLDQCLQLFTTFVFYRDFMIFSPVPVPITLQP